MSTTQIKSMFHRVADVAFNCGNLAALDELFASDFIDHTAPWGIVARGPEVLRQEITTLRTAFPDLQITIEDIIDERDKFAARHTLRGTHKGPFVGTPPTGKQVMLLAVSYGRVAKGKFVESWTVSDNLSMLQQIGLVPPPSQNR